MVAAVAVLFAITATHNAALRSSCDASDGAIGSIPAGTQVEIQFAVSDGSNCYKIAASVDGKSVAGYVDAAALSGIKAFEEQRKGGIAVNDATIRSDAVLQLLKQSAPDSRRIADLLNSNQPAQALQFLEPLLQRHPHDAGLIGLAALAAYRSDDLRRAGQYCRDAAPLDGDLKLAAFCRVVDRESKADKSGEKIYGLRVALRYEGDTLPADVARSMVAALDEEFSRISGRLGCPAEERITAIVQSREAYYRGTNAAEWSGGLYDGRIHVPLIEGARIGPQTRRTFAHETVHACLANIGSFPAWLHEGLAQKLSGDTLSSAARQDLRVRIGAGSLPKLENIGQNWSRLNPENARAAYALALAAADALVDNYANYGLRNILRNPGLLLQVTAEIDKTLGL